MEDILIDMLYQEMLMDTLREGKIIYGDHIWFAKRLSVIGPKNFNFDQFKGKIACLKRRQRKFTDPMKQTDLGGTLRGRLQLPTRNTGKFNQGEIIILAFQYQGMPKV